MHTHAQVQLRVNPARAPTADDLDRARTEIKRNFAQKEANLMEHSGTELMQNLQEQHQALLNCGVPNLMLGNVFLPHTKPFSDIRWG